MRMAYQPAIKAAKPMPNSRSTLVMLAENTTTRPGLAISRHTFVEQRISEPGDHSKKFAGFFRVLLVGQFTRSMFGIECCVDGGQGVKPVANRQAAHQEHCVWRLRKPCPVRLLCRWFSSAYFLLK